MVEIKEYSYSGVLDDSFPYKQGKLSSYLRDSFKLITLENNPLYKSTNHPEVVVAVVDNVLAGATVFMPTRLMIEGQECDDVLSGAGIETLIEYRKYDIGADLMFYPFTNTKFEHVIYSGISPEALKMYKALGFRIISTPYYIQPRTGRIIMGMTSIKGGFAFFLTSLLTVLIKPVIMLEKCLFLSTKKRFRIDKMNDVPEWVNDIIYSDQHKYAELHDRSWLQWTLDNSFYHREFDRQSFYAVYYKDKPVGFFCTNERQKTVKGGRIKDVVFGNVYEWGSVDETLLSEFDIFKLAQYTFSKRVDVVTFSSPNVQITKRIRKYLFAQHGYAHIVYKNTKKKCKDADDPRNWRIRFGYCDTPFYF